MSHTTFLVTKTPDGTGTVEMKLVDNGDGTHSFAVRNEAVEALLISIDDRLASMDAKQSTTNSELTATKLQLKAGIKTKLDTITILP